MTINVGMIGPILPYSNNIGGPLIHRTELTKYLKKYCNLINVFATSKTLDNNIKIIDKLRISQKKYLKTLNEIKMMILLNKSIDVFHIHYFAHSIFPKKILQTPLVLTYHGYLNEIFETRNLKKNKITKKMINYIEKKIIYKVDALIVVGIQVKNKLIEKYNISPKKIVYIPNGVNCTQFNPMNYKNIRSKLGFNKKDYVIVFNKSLTIQNGIQNLIQAFKNIKNIYSNIKLMIIGDGPLRQQIENYIIKNRLSKSIKLLGMLPHDLIPIYLNNSDLYILPSIQHPNIEETFGISLIEAMACELPVIVSNIGGPKEIIEKGNKEYNNVGLLISPNNILEIEEKIINCVVNKKYYMQCGKRARFYVKKTYDWDLIAKQTLNVYKFVLKSF